jgi:hypothetical protein
MPRREDVKKCFMLNNPKGLSDPGALMARYGEMAKISQYSIKLNDDR